MNTMLNILSSKSYQEQDNTPYLQALKCIPKLLFEIDLALATNNMIALNSNLNKYASYFDVIGLQHITKAMHIVEKQCLDAKNLFDIEPSVERIKLMLNTGQQTFETR